MHATELWNSRKLGPTLIRLALSPLSGLYALGWEAYLATYRFGLKRAKHPHRPILCVGNLVSGGSGKTPVTIHLIDVLRELGYSVVVSCSGYGSPRSEAATVAPEGPLHASEWGDEAALFRLKQPDTPLIVGRRRPLAAQLCADHFPTAVLLMDDGFQHLPLKKDLSIILDPSSPQNRLCLPAGPYREGRWNRKRADLVLPDQYRMEEYSLGLLTPGGAQKEGVANVSLLCALGQPENVIRSLEAQGVTVRDRFLLPDHDPLSGGTLVNDLPADIPAVVTAKDWVKLRSRADVSTRDFLILDHQVTIQPASEFKAWLQSKLDGIIQEKANHS